MLDFGFMARCVPLFVKAAELTVKLAFWGIVMSTVLGLICALIRYWKIPVLQRLIGVYIELARNTPLMIQLFFLYYGLPRLGLLLEGTTCAIAGLTFLGGAYMAEAFRGGLNAVGRSQIEVGMSIGLKPSQILRHVVLPQALAVSLPVLTATAIFLIKETSVFSIVALPDLMYVAKDLLKEGHSTESNILLVLSYLVIILPVSLIFGWLERRVRFAGFGY
ncbi:MAG: amino acid ABC transporter permease [Deltaproteobacteria bacterium]|jgi:polar amino acid transport system permease protein|nr:amino acid ABC transporter permease [Deltaproteobacteria bacterium]